MCQFLEIRFLCLPFFTSKIVIKLGIFRLRFIPLQRRPTTKLINLYNKSPQFLSHFQNWPESRSYIENKLLMLFLCRGGEQFSLRGSKCLWVSMSRIICENSVVGFSTADNWPPRMTKPTLFTNIYIHIHMATLMLQYQCRNRHTVHKNSGRVRKNPITMSNLHHIGFGFNDFQRPSHQTSLKGRVGWTPLCVPSARRPRTFSSGRNSFRSGLLMRVKKNTTHSCCDCSL